MANHFVETFKNKMTNQSQSMTVILSPTIFLGTPVLIESLLKLQLDISHLGPIWISPIRLVGGTVLRTVFAKKIRIGTDQKWSTDHTLIWSAIIFTLNSRSPCDLIADHFLGDLFIAQITYLSKKYKLIGDLRSWTNGRWFSW